MKHIHILLLYFAIISSLSLVVETIVGDHEETYGIYPPLHAWEVDSGNGNWIDDHSIVTKCYIGDEGGTTTTATRSSTTSGTIEDDELLVIIGGVGSNDNTLDSVEMLVENPCRIPDYPAKVTGHTGVLTPVNLKSSVLLTL